MNPEDALSQIIDPCLARLSVLGIRNDDRARVMLLAIALQESGLTHRAQVVDGGGKGPARGFWQFEKNGVLGVLKHPMSEPFAAKLCFDVALPVEVEPVWQRLEDDDVLACAFARLLLFTDRAPLPQVGEDLLSWQYYVRNWRPGKPHPTRWPGNYRRAREAVRLSNTPAANPELQAQVRKLADRLAVLQEQLEAVQTDMRNLVQA